MSEIIRWFWKIRYAIYNRDLYVALREGRGSKENPLRIEDLKPLMKALERIGESVPLLLLRGDERAEND